MLYYTFHGNFCNQFICCSKRLMITLSYTVRLFVFVWFCFGYWNFHRRHLCYSLFFFLSLFRYIYFIQQHYSLQALPVSIWYLIITSVWLPENEKQKRANTTITSHQQQTFRKHYEHLAVIVKISMPECESISWVNTQK